jgi:hypothetical protein
MYSVKALFYKTMSLGLILLATGVSFSIAAQCSAVGYNLSLNGFANCDDPDGSICVSK